MIYYDPTVKRFRDTKTGYFINGTEDYLEDLLEDYEEEIEDIFGDMFLLVEQKRELKLKTKRKSTSLGKDAVSQRLKEVMDNFEEIMDEEVLY